MLKKIGDKATWHAWAAVLLAGLMAGGFSAPRMAQAATVTYYVSPAGNDATGAGTQANPWATLARTASAINGAGAGGDYTIYVMDDLVAAAGARYYDHNVTIASDPDAHRTVSVMRGTPFATQADTRRGEYNPAMLEIDTTAPGVNLASLTLSNITFNDAYLNDAATPTTPPANFKTFSYVPAPIPTGLAGTNYVQDAIVAAYDRACAIVLDNGATLENFGGMTAIYASGGATVTLKSGSLITDVGASASTRTNDTPYDANGDTAVFLAAGNLDMQQGAAITNLANVYGVKAVNSYLTGVGPKIYVDGAISGLIGGNGSEVPAGGGTGVKSAVYVNTGAVTVDFQDAIDALAALSPAGSIMPNAAIIGPHARIIDNTVKSGAVEARAGIVDIYGKINGNINLPGDADTTNGAGLFVIGYATAYLENGSEIRNNTVQENAASSGQGIGGGVYVQQGYQPSGGPNGARLFMNGGTVAGNVASTAPGVAVSKWYATFTMNGGVIDNGPDGVMLLYFSDTGNPTRGILFLNAGDVSGVTVDSALDFAASDPKLQRFLYLKDGVRSGTGYVSVAGRRVTPIQANFNIGNPNTVNYASIRSALPQGWSLPSNDADAIGFWMQKAGTAAFSVPQPTAGYVPDLDLYLAAVQGTTAAGTVDAASAVAFYPAARDASGNIAVAVPLDAYPNGATVVLVQPATASGSIVVDAPAALNEQPGGGDYALAYSAAYAMPSGWRDALLAADYANTSIVLTIQPDARTVCADPGLTFDSAVFAMDGSPVWDAANGQLRVALSLKNGWDTASDLDTNFSFACTLAAANFQDGGVLNLSSQITLEGTLEGASVTNRIDSNLASTVMVGSAQPPSGPGTSTLGRGGSAPIPTLGTAGLGLLTVLLGLAAVRRRRS